MGPILMVFRLAALGALLLGLGYLFDLVPLWTRDIHMLLGIIVVLAAAAVAWQVRSTPSLLGALLAVAVLVLGVGFRVGWWGGAMLGLVHLAAALGAIGLVEAAAARARRVARQ